MNTLVPCARVVTLLLCASVVTLFSPATSASEQGPEMKVQESLKQAHSFMRISVKGLDATRAPTTNELMAAGQMFVYHLLEFSNVRRFEMIPDICKIRCL